MKLQQLVLMEDMIWLTHNLPNIHGQRQVQGMHVTSWARFLTFSWDRAERIFVYDCPTTGQRPEETSQDLAPPAAWALNDPKAGSAGCWPMTQTSVRRTKPFFSFFSCGPQPQNFHHHSYIYYFLIPVCIFQLLHKWDFSSELCLRHFADSQVELFPQGCLN